MEKVQAIDVMFSAATGEGQNAVVCGKKLLSEDAVAELEFNPKKLAIPRPLKDKLLAIKRGKDDDMNKMFFDNFATIMERRQDAMEFVQLNKAVNKQQEIQYKKDEKAHQNAAFYTIHKLVKGGGGGGGTGRRRVGRSPRRWRTSQTPPLRRCPPRRGVSPRRGGV